MTATAAEACSGSVCTEVPPEERGDDLLHYARRHSFYGTCTAMTDPRLLRLEQVVLVTTRHAATSSVSRARCAAATSFATLASHRSFSICAADGGATVVSELHVPTRAVTPEGTRAATLASRAVAISYGYGDAIARLTSRSRESRISTVRSSTRGAAIGIRDRPSIATPTPR